MRQYVRGILILLSAVATVCLVLVLALFFIVTPKHIEARIASDLRSHYGIEWTPSAEVTLKRLPQFVVTLPKGRLVLPSETPLVADYDRMTITLEPLAYFAQTPKIRQITVEGLTVHTSTLPSLREVSQIAQRWAAYPIDRLEFINTTVLEGNKEAAVPILTLTKLTSQREKFTHFALTLDGKLTRGEQLGEFSLTTHLTWPDATTLSAITLENTVLHYRGTMANEPWSFSLTVGRLAELTSQAPLVEALSGHLFTPWANANGQASSVRVSDDRYTLTQLAGEVTLASELYPVTLEGAANASWLNRGEIRLDDLLFQLKDKKTGQPLGHLNGAMDWIPATPSGHLTLEGSLSGAPVAVKLVVDPTDNASPAALPHLSGEVHLNQLPAMGQRAIDPLLSLIGIAQGDVRLSIDDAQGISLDTMLAFSETQVSTRDLQLRMPSGDFTGDVTLSSQGDWQAHLLGNQLKLSQLSHISPIQGNASLSAVGHGNLHDFATHHWETELQLHEGCLLGGDFPLAMKILEDEQPEQLPAEAFRPESQSCFKGGRVVAESTTMGWSISVLTLNADTWTMTGFGELNGSQLSLKNTFATKATSFSPSIRLASDLTMLAGGNPQWTPNWNDALTQARTIFTEPGWQFSHLYARMERTVCAWWDSLVKSLTNWWNSLFH